MVAVERPVCQVCGDRFQAEAGDHCGRCHDAVCRACSRRRGRRHETVLCRRCVGSPAPTGLHATPIYRAWKRLTAGP